MRHLESWEIAGLICDMLLKDGTDTTARQHEKMADIILKYHNLVWNAHNQEWRDPADD